MDNRSFSQKVKDHFVQFLAKQINPPPLLFFSLYVYCHLKIQSPDYIAYTFFTVGVIFALLFSYNHFYVYSPVLNGGIGYLSILNLVLGLLAANEKWKLYLYLFIIGDSITMEYPQISKWYTICCCLYLCIDIHKNLTFKMVQDNVIFFIGFFTIFIFELFSKLIQSTEGYSGIPYFTVPFAILIAYKLITTRVQALKKQDIMKLRNVELIYHYILLIQQQIKSPYTRQGFIQTHKDNCSNVNCFCRKDYMTNLNSDQLAKMKFGTKVQYYYVRNLFEQAMTLKSLPKREFLENKFIDFLIENNQITEAIEMFTKLQTLSAKFYYFRWVQRSRLYYKIRDKLQQFDYFNVFSKQFVYVFKYDLSYLYLASEIKQILKNKVQFWKQVGRQTPLMIRLQLFGSEIVQKMYNLNNFYYKQIKEQEQKINNFNGTIMYAMYLLSTTNYKQYAESLIKNTSRTLESIKIHEDNIAQTFGLKVLIRDSKKSCNQKIQALDSIVDAQQLERFMDEGQECYSALSLHKQHRERAQRYSAFYQDGFVETITNISGSLCKLLKTSKNDMLGKDLNTIIPKSYQQRHHAKLGRLLHYDSQKNKEIVTLSFINKLRQVPLKTVDNKLITAKISVKICEDIQEGISFIALVQTINENKVTLIANIQGQVQEYEEGLSNLKIIECQEIANVMKELKEQWESDSNISNRKINLTYQDNNYSISFSSPYQVSFLYKNAKEAIQENLESQDEGKRLYQRSIERIQMTPPIHIDIINESIPYLVNPRQDREEEMTKCIKKMQSVFYKTDIDSQSSTNSSRKSSVVNVLMSFSENYFIPFYGYIMGVFALVLIASIVANSIGFTQLSLPWDNSQKPKNPISNILSIMDMRHLITETLNHQMDLEQYNKTWIPLNRTNVHTFYGLDKSNYSTYVAEHANRTKKLYKKAVSSTMMYVSDILSQDVEKAWQVVLPTTNPRNNDTTKNTQMLPLQNIFMNYLVDLDLLSLSKPYSITIISLNFWTMCQYILTKLTSLNQNIKSYIDKTILLNILYSSITTLVIVFSIVPVFILLKKRVKRHIDIYDLIVSVEGQLIRQQVKKLDNIITIVNNSNESSQVLKTNTINYLARKRSSALNDNLGGSNEMIEGLIQNKNDSITEQQGQSGISQGQQTKNGLIVKKPSKIQSYMKNKQNDEIVGQENKKLTLRKRSGELDLKGSEGDFKTVVCKHWILYLIILISTISLFAIVVCKVKYYGHVRQRFLQIEDIYQNFIDEGLLLLNTKLYFRGMQAINFPYHDSTFIAWLQKQVYKNAGLQFTPDFPQSTINPPCIGKNESHYLFCQRNYSLLTLRQEVNHYIKQAYEQRLRLEEQYNITAANMTKIPKTQLQNMSEYFFYVQSMRDRISNYSRQYVEHSVQQMFQGQKELDYILQIIFIAGLGWGVISLIIGLFLVNYMKKLYFKEIIIVSFLNNEMISKNKRVESFLQTLSKSSY